MSTAVMGTSTRRAGRPYRPPEDAALPADPTPDPRPRVAWLLGTSRILCADGAYAHRRAFISALRERGISVDETRVSRWESGAAPVPRAAIAAYESILGLPQDHLQCAVDHAYGMRRELTLEVREPVTPESLDDLVTTCLGGTATGRDWIALGALVSDERSVFLRAGEWAALANRLVSEFSRSLGPGFVYRASAIRALFAHPVTQRHVVRAAGEVALDPRMPQRTSVISLLPYVSGNQIGELVLRLVNSTDEAISDAACSAAAAMLADGQFPQRHVDDLLEPLVRILHQRPGSEAAVDLATRMPARHIAVVRSRTDGPLLSQALKTFEVVEPAVARRLAHEVAAVALPQASARLVEADAMLERLIRSALFGIHGRRVTGARGLLRVSPFAGGFAAGCERLLDHPNPIVAARALSVMRWFIRPEQAVSLARSTLPSTAFRSGVLTGFSQLPHPEHDVVEVLASNLHDPAPEVSAAAAYAAGMLGLDFDLPPTHPQYDTVRWWAENGSRLVG